MATDCCCCSSQMATALLGLFLVSTTTQALLAPTLPVVKSTGAWSKIVAIGDIHGDRLALESCLRAGALINDDGEWSAPAKTLVVQCGDVMDRGCEDWRCLKRLAALKTEANAQGSEVAMVLGNHEIENLLHRFVTQPNWHAGRTWPSLEDLYRDVSTTNDDFRGQRHLTPDEADEIVKGRYRGDSRFRKKPSWDSPPSDRRDAVVQANVDAFSPGGVATRALRDLCGATPFYRVDGDTVFVHGAIDKSASPEDLDRWNRSVRQWLMGDRDYDEEDDDFDSVKYWVWSDSYATLGSWYDVPDDHFKDLLDRLHATRIVGGHNVGNCVRSKVGGTIFQIDAGVSHYYLDNPPEVLILEEGKSPSTAIEDDPGHRITNGLTNVAIRNAMAFGGDPLFSDVTNVTLTFEKDTWKRKGVYSEVQPWRYTAQVQVPTSSNLATLARTRRPSVLGDQLFEEWVNDFSFRSDDKTRDRRLLNFERLVFPSSWIHPPETEPDDSMTPEPRPFISRLFAFFRRRRHK